MDWTVVTRSKQKQRRVQIFVKVNGSKASPMEVSLTDDRVEDVMRRIQNDEDAYVTMHGRVLEKGERLKSCGVTDGCIVQVTSRLRGGGKHKDKKGQKERKRAAKPQGPEQKVVQECDRDAAIRMIEENEESRKMMVRMLEENEDNRKMIESMSEGSDVDMEQTLQNYRTACRDVPGWDREQVGMMERGLRWAVEARRKERREEQEQRRQEEQEEQRREEQEQRRQEEQEETRAESTDEPEVTSRPVEVRTGRGSAGLVRGGDGRHLADESNRKGKGKGNGGKGEHGGKGGVQVEEEEHRWDAKRKVVRMMKREEDQEANEEEQGRVAPNMEAGGSHPQATSDTREARVLSWADCKDEEVQNEEEVEQEEERRQRETTEERPPGLEEEEVESEPKTQQEEELTQVESEQEARKEQKRAQEAREEQRREQEAREEQRRAQEAQEEQRRAQEAQEEKKAQEERERLARKDKAQEERRQQDREAVAQEGARGQSEGPRRARRRCEFNARREPRVEQTHDVVAQRMVGPSQQRTTPADGKRPSKSVASSHQGRAGSARHGKGCGGRKGETGAREDRKQHSTPRDPPSHRKHCNCNGRSSCSNCSNSALAMTQDAFALNMRGTSRDVA